MSIIVEFRVQSSGFVLEEALDEVPEMELELVREVGTEAERPYLFVWASGDDFDRFETAMEADETVTDVERYQTVAERTLYRMRIAEATEVVAYPVWVEVGGDQLEACYVDGWWHDRMRLPDREALSQIRAWCDERDVTLDLERVYTDTPDGDPDRLTDAQREVLRLGYDLGYFEVPREATVADIAAELDISGQAVSERLRRGHRTLVSRYLSGIDCS